MVRRVTGGADRVRHDHPRRARRAERANALLKETFTALQMVSLSPTRIGATVKAALVLLDLEHGRPLPSGYTK
jgi:hypothetical protein